MNGLVPGPTQVETIRAAQIVALRRQEWPLLEAGHCWLLEPRLLFIANGSQDIANESKSHCVSRRDFGLTVWLVHTIVA